MSAYTVDRKWFQKVGSEYWMKEKKKKTHTFAKAFIIKCLIINGHQVRFRTTLKGHNRYNGTLSNWGGGYDFCKWKGFFTVKMGSSIPQEQV